MHGGNGIPASLDQQSFSAKPDWLDSDRKPRGDVMVRDAARVSLKTLAEECGVGCFGDDSVRIVGSNIGETIYQALLQEETARKGPPVPLPDTMVYRSSTSSIFKEPAPKGQPPKRARAPRPVASRSASSRTVSERSTSNRIPSSQGTSTRKPSSRNVSNRSEPPAPTAALLQPILINPTEPSTLISDTDPASVTRLLHTLSASLTSALSPNTTKIRAPKHLASIYDRPHVLKWVDYTNKYGIGYILANGSIGVIFNGTDTRPSTCVSVPSADTHVRNRYSPSYSERLQLVPRDGPPISFLENRGDDGIHCVQGNPADFRVKISKTGTPEKFGPAPGLSSFDNEKRRLLSLWDKFARYMYQTLGEKTPHPSSSGTDANNQQSPFNAEPFVKFYQRLGNVGVWGFRNGCFQFNFPDHTKLVISCDGWVDFYHNSIAAAQMLKKGRPLSAEALEERGLISLPLRTLLAGRHEREDFRSLIEVNEFEQKVAFVKSIVETWIENGGLGRMGKAAQVKWEGISEPGHKERLVWATVGARGGDLKRAEMGKKT